MAPIKFEDHIREQLEGRRIEPSAGSWEKLNQRLDNAPEGKKSFGWLYVAVAAVAAILIVSVFFTTHQNTEVAAPIVENPAETPIENPAEKQEAPASFEPEERIAVEENTSGQKEEILKPEIQKKPVISSEEITGEFSQTEENVAEVIPNNGVSEELEKAEKPKLEELLLTSKIEELVAEVAKKEENGTVTDAEVNELLAEAAREISQQRNFYNRGKVDADALLADVESEIDQSFRREVFEMLKDGFQKARTAIVSRNY